VPPLHEPFAETMLASHAELTAAPRARSVSSHQSSDSCKLREGALRNLAMSNPDLAIAVQLRPSTRMSDNSTQSSWSLPTPGASPGNGAAPPRVAESDFARLAKVARLEADEKALHLQIESVKSDAKAHDEVVLKPDLQAATAKNETNHEIAELKAANDKQSASTEARLALAEKMFRALKVRAAVRPRRHSQLSLPGLGNDPPISDDSMSMGSAQLGPEGMARQHDSVQEGVDALAGLRGILLALELVGGQAHVEARVSTLSVTAVTRRQPWNTESVFATAIGDVPRSAYSSTSPLEKVSSAFPPLRRCRSVPTTLGERIEITGTAAMDRDLDPETSSIIDPSAGEYELKCAGLLPVQANHMHNTSLRHVSDTRNFWRVFVRQKFNRILGFTSRAPGRRNEASAFGGGQLCRSVM